MVPRRKKTKALLIGSVFAVLATSLALAPASAHVFTKADGNDSPGRLDIRSTTLGHTSKAIVFKIRTYNTWTPQSLGDDSFFVVQIDKNNDRRYERCAFIFYFRGLRGSLTNCGSNFIRNLPVARPNGTTARISVPKSETGLIHWWAVATLWDGPRPCGRGCVDFSPNRFPDILHDLQKPIVTIDPFSQISTDFSASTTVPIGFTSTDQTGVGVATWQVQTSPPGSLPWTTRAQGSGGGANVGNITLQQGTSYNVRVLAIDRHGNVGASQTRILRVPFDDSAGVMQYSGTWTPVTDAEYFEGGHQAGDAGDSVSFTVTGTGIMIVSGPGTGTISVSLDGGPPQSVAMSDARPKRGTITRDWALLETHTVTLTVDPDSTFVFDGVVVLR